jgi:hypothetical protein
MRDYGTAGNRQGAADKVPPTSVETPSYYPFQVKGYQNSYPRRRVLVLMPLDSRDFKDVGGQIHEPVNGNPAVPPRTLDGSPPRTLRWT